MSVRFLEQFLRAFSAPLCATVLKVTRLSECSLASHTHRSTEEGSGNQLYKVVSPLNAIS